MAMDLDFDFDCPECGAKVKTSVGALAAERTVGCVRTLDQFEGPAALPPSRCQSLDGFGSTTLPTASMPQPSLDHSCVPGPVRPKKR